MDLVRSWLVAVVVLVACAAGGAVVGVQYADPEWLRTAMGAATWSGGLAFVTYALTAGLAGLAYGTDRREQRLRRLLAVLPVPALAVLVGAVLALLRGGAPVVVASEAVLGAAGTAVGWFASRALRGRSEERTDRAAEAAYRY